TSSVGRLAGLLRLLTGRTMNARAIVRIQEPCRSQDGAPRRRRERMHTLIGRIITSSLIGLSLLAGASASAGEPADTGDVIAVWKSQRVAFDYRSDGRYYSCGALEHKIKLILEELGADARLELRRSSCRDLASLTRFELVMRSPVEATEANVREITDYGSEAQ